MKLRNWLIKRLLPKPTPQIISMSERKAYRIYAEMKRIDGIMDLFEMRKQVAYIQAATTKDEHEWGRILNMDELIDNMEIATIRLKEITDAEKEPKPEGDGYKSTVEGV